MSYLIFLVMIPAMMRIQIRSPWSAMFFFFKQKTAYEMRISDWSSDVCSSDLTGIPVSGRERAGRPRYLLKLSCAGLTRASRATATSLALDPRLGDRGRRSEGLQQIRLPTSVVPGLVPTDFTRNKLQGRHPRCW